MTTSKSHDGELKPKQFVRFEYDGATGASTVTRSDTPFRVLVKLDDGSCISLEEFKAQDAAPGIDETATDTPRIVSHQSRD